MNELLPRLAFKVPLIIPPEYCLLKMTPGHPHSLVVKEVVSHMAGCTVSPGPKGIKYTLDTGACMAKIPTEREMEGKRL